MIWEPFAALLLFNTAEEATAPPSAWEEFVNKGVQKYQARTTNLDEQCHYIDRDENLGVWSTKEHEHDVTDGAERQFSHRLGAKRL